ncbi:acyl carrier protein [Amycolatopsis sp. PS_44_ISF1]|uniref:acyl carrier protein n=1 Tax=Amycolatopsis sp. PS_44_ISF1 TaxID=2974917 RepID=UPI0028DF4F2A|nr:acyl carrier protein [Amycolatopsis sp. PS_44_ISF1]MDT8913889.1 acyl carrier protein [Amycolatopsis sp. PS_44_ISF1]
MNSETDRRKAVIKELACDAFEIEPEELEEDTLFDEDLGIDSLSAIDLLAALEKHFGLEVEQVDLSRLNSLASVYDLVAEELGWAAAGAVSAPETASTAG